MAAEALGEGRNSERERDGDMVGGSGVVVVLILSILDIFTMLTCEGQPCIWTGFLLLLEPLNS